MRLIHCLATWVAVVLLAPAAPAADELPPRAVARLGGHHFFHGGQITYAVMSGDGRRIASTGFAVLATTDEERVAFRRRVCVWDAATGKCLRELAAGKERVYCLALSPDGKRLAAGCDYQVTGPCLVVFDVDSGEALLHLTDFEEEVFRVQFSADGKQLHVVEREGSVSAWDATTGKRLRVCKPPAPPPVRTAEGTVKESACEGLLSPDGKLVLWRMLRYVASEDGPTLDLGRGPDANVLRVHDAKTDKELYRKELANESFDLVQFSPDGKHFSARCRRLTVWEAASGKEILCLKGVTDIKEYTLTADASIAAVQHGDNRLRLWNLRTGERLHDLCPFVGGMRWPAPGTSLAFSPDHKTLLVPDSSTLRLFDVASGKEFLPAPGHRTPVRALSFSADGKTLVSRGDDVLCRWDVPSRKETGRLAVAQEPPERDRILDYSADGRLFLDQAFAFPLRIRGWRINDRRQDSRIRLRDTATGRVVCELGESPSSWVEGLFSPGGDKVLVCEVSRKAATLRYRCAVYDVATGKEQCRFTTENPEEPWAFSSDGRLLAWADAAYSVHLLDTATGKPLRTLKPVGTLLPNSRGLARLVFSADGAYLVCASGPYPELNNSSGMDRTPVPVRVFDVGRGRETARFFLHPEDEGRSDRPVSLTFSPDNRLLVVSNACDPRIRLIEIASGKVRAELSGHRADVLALALAPDGRTLASGGLDNVVFLWDVTGERTLPKPSPPDDKQLAACWKDLAGADADRAGNALFTFRQAPKSSIAFLEERLRPVPRVEEKEMARLLADLDSNTFEAREAASRDLVLLEERAEEALRRALPAAPPEAKRRIQELLDKLDRHSLSPEALREVRAVEALEHIGTTEARRLLETLAAGAPGARLTRDAQASLRRLAGLVPPP